jgi:hypothetical protein
VQADLGSAFCHLASERALVDRRLEAGVHAAAGRTIEHQPGLGLAKVGRIELRCGEVIGMDLHREISLAIEIFEDQRETRLRRMLAEQLGAALLD